jgi:uncharacterized protein (DUF2062 family)
LVFIDRIKDIVKLKESPHRVALAFSTGVFIGMSPMLGLHTVLGVLAAWLFRLNTFAIIAGVYVTNLWTIVPIYAFSTWLGTQCLGINLLISDIDWSNVTFNNVLSSFEHLLLPFIFGSLLIGSITSIFSYIIIYMAAKKHTAFNLFNQ